MVVWRTTLKSLEPSLNCIKKINGGHAHRKNGIYQAFIWRKKVIQDTQESKIWLAVIKKLKKIFLNKIFRNKSLLHEFSHSTNIYDSFIQKLNSRSSGSSI
jgi:hypothetical protein